MRTSIIYGANASGKSNIIKAMAFAKYFIVNGVSKTENIEIYNFKLDKTCYQKPSRFEFEFRYKDEIWFIKKHQNRESQIYSLAYADVEKLDLMKGYINGRFGAITFIPNMNELNWNI